MTSPHAIRMVCFDLGGVLVRICRTWAEGCRAAGLPVHEGLDTAEMVTARREASTLHATGRLAGPAYFGALSRSTGDRYSPAEVERIHHAWSIEEYPGVDRVIDRLLAIPGIETGVLSNTNHEHWEVQMGPAGAGRYPTVRRLRHRHASHLIGHVKPSHEIYRGFERRTGFHGRDILFFDDLEENVAAALKAGWIAEQVDHTGDTAAQLERHLTSYGVLPRV